jgi:hypothetical protein
MSRSVFQDQKGARLSGFHGLTITYLKHFGFGLRLTLPLLLKKLSGGNTLLRQTVGRKEGWTHFDRFCWSFITATTVGYGDCRLVNRGQGCWQY